MAISLTIMSIDFDSFEAPVTKTFNQNEITIGRTENNDLVLDRAEISAHHAKISVKKNGSDDQLHLFVKDLGSSSGTMVERDPLEPDTEVKINSNQRLIIGSYLIKPNIVEEQNKTSEPELLGIDELMANTDTQNLIIDDQNDSSGYIKPTSCQELNNQILREEVEEIPASLAEEIEVSGINSTKKSVIEIFPIEDSSSIKESNISTQEILPASTNHLATTEDKTTTSSIYSATTSLAESTPAVARIILENSNILDLNFTALELLNLKGRVLYKDSGLAAVLVDAGALGKIYTDSQGYFEFKNIEEGTPYQIILNKEGYTFESSALSGTIEMPTELEARAIKLFSISGKILHQGKGIAGVLVNVPNIGATTTMTDGTFKFSNIKEGTSYELKVSKNKFIFDTFTGNKIIDQNVDFTINAKELFNIGGKIIHKGKPVSGVEIECVNVGKTTSDANGAYSFENVPEGQEYTIKANKAGFVLKQSRVH